MKLIKTKFQILIICISLPLLFGGCQTLPSVPMFESSETGTLQTAEKQLQETGRDFTVTVAQGAFLGAATGAATAALISGNTGDILIGAAVGGIAGGVGGYYVAKTKEEYASEEDRISSMITDVKEDNNNLKKYITATMNYVNESKLRLTQLTEQYNQQTISKTDIQNQLNRITKNRTQIASAIDTLKSKKQEYIDALKNQSEVSKQSSVSMLDKEISILGIQVAKLEQQLVELDNVLQISAVG